MRGKVDCFLPCQDLGMAELTIEQLRNDNAVRHIFLLVSKQLACIDRGTVAQVAAQCGDPAYLGKEQVWRRCAAEAHKGTATRLASVF